MFLLYVKSGRPQFGANRFENFSASWILLGYRFATDMIGFVVDVELSRRRNFIQDQRAATIYDHYVAALNGSKFQKYRYFV